MIMNDSSTFFPKVTNVSGAGFYVHREDLWIVEDLHYKAKSKSGDFYLYPHVLPISGMASPILLAQQVFSALSANNMESPLNTGCINSTASNATISQDATKVAGFPTDVSSLIAFLVSFSALRDWLKLLIFGSVLETLRRLGLQLYYKIYSSFFITAKFEEDDSSYGMLHVLYFCLRVLMSSFFKTG